jgi:hypothetical protein
MCTKQPSLSIRSLLWISWTRSKRSLVLWCIYSLLDFWAVLNSRNHWEVLKIEWIVENRCVSLVRNSNSALLTITGSRRSYDTQDLISRIMHVIQVENSYGNMWIILPWDNVSKTQQIGVIIEGEFTLNFTGLDNACIIWIFQFGKRKEKYGITHLFLEGKYVNMWIILPWDNVIKTQQIGVVIEGEFTLHFIGLDNACIIWIF